MTDAPRSLEVGGVMSDVPPHEDTPGEPWPVPTWALLAAIVGVSAVIRFLYAIHDPAAWIFPDETVYAELAKALAYTGEFAIRDNLGTNGLGVVYPILIAPAFLLFDKVADAHDAVKAINSILMSLTAVPVYFLARRLVTRSLALTAAALSLAIPAMTYTGTVMTENAFYPLTAIWALLLVRALERPTLSRQTLLVVGIGVAYLTRAQAALFVPVLVTAILLLAALEHGPRLWRGLWPYRVTWLLLVLGAAGVGVRQLVRGERLSDVLGAYIALRDYSYDVADVSHWALYHLAELVISLGVFPFAVFVIACLFNLRPAARREHRIFAVAAVSLVFWFLVVVSAFANTPVALRIEERYLFHVAPLFFIALVVWIAQGLPRPWWALAPAALFAAALPAALPINNFLNETAVHDTVGLLPIWRWRDRIFSPGSIDEVVVAAAVVAALIVVLIPRRFAVVIPVALFLYFAAATRPVEAFIYRASYGAWEAGVRPVPNWVDRAVGSDADVAQVWTGGGNHFSFWESEFYNRSVGAVYALSQPFDSFGQRMASTQPDGRVEYLGEPLELRYALTDAWTKLRGQLVARNELTLMATYRIDGPLVVIEQLQGLYPDLWSGPFAGYRRFDCSGGSVRFTVDTNPTLHRRAFVVTVVQHGVETNRLRVRARPAVKVLSIPLRPRDGFCDVQLQIPTRSATAATPGDLRELGLHFQRVRYVPPR
jgi:4-amino-4-deoxy-L-arabinose transferase-like glycosyltransferase